jgi:multicomponent Na+:H+ antiporter subunit B
MLEFIAVHHLALYSMLFLTLLVSVLLVISASLIRSVILLTIFSLIMASIYLLLAAPDVAMTEAAIGACISTVIFLAVLPVAGSEKLSQKINMPAIIICSATAGVIIYATLGLPDFGNKNSIPNLSVSPYYISHTEQDMGIPNIVTAILAGYRSFDTLGETFVIFTSLAAVMAIFSTGSKTRNKD